MASCQVEVPLSAPAPNWFGANPPGTNEWMPAWYFGLIPQCEVRWTAGDQPPAMQTKSQSIRRPSTVTPSTALLPSTSNEVTPLRRSATETSAPAPCSSDTVTAALSLLVMTTTFLPHSTAKRL